MERNIRKKILGGYPAAGVIISTSIALFVFGLFGNLIIYSKQFGTIVRDNLNVKVYLRSTITETQRQQLERTIQAKEFVATGEKAITFKSKEDAEKDLVKEIGNYKEILGENPLKDLFIVRIKPELQDTTHLKQIKADLEKLNGVHEATYEKGLIDTVNENIKNISIYLLIISSLLIITTFILVNNTLRLALFSQRFLIRSMQLVGARQWFIINPFLIRAIGYGFLSGIIASLAIWRLSNYVQRTIPQIVVLHNPNEFLLMLLILTLVGAIVSCSSTFFSIRRYLKMSLDDLY